jgi:PAS domain S-box-containing protein
MTDWIVSSPRHRRWAIFVRAQSPVTVTVALLFVVVLPLGPRIDHPGWLALGGAIVLLATVLAIVVPWRRLPLAVRLTLPVLNLIGIGVLALALYDVVDTVSMLAAFPAIWLASTFGIPGAAVAVVATYAVSVTPLLVTPGERTGSEWASALVAPVVITVLTVVAILFARAARASIAARNEASAQTERSAAVLRSFADKVDLGLVFLDEQGESVLFNQAVVDFGTLAEHGNGSGSGTRVFAEDQVTPLPPQDQPLARLKRGETFADFLYWVGPRGGQRALLANGSIVDGADGRPAGAILVVQDVTEILRATRAQEDALATLAHELRTPLTSIVGYSELLLMDELSATASARLEVIVRNADHLLTVTTSFLDGLHRQVEIERERFALRALVDDAVTALRATPDFAERQLQVDVDPELSVLADRMGLSAVLNNLLSNAVKFSQSCDRITIAAGEDDAWVSLVVHNSGSSIDPADLERIFDRFYRGGNAQREAIAGTGIGLSISRQIVAAHGGRLTAEQVDEGASFKVCLPRD